MNIKVGEKKVNSFSVGNPASGLGDAIVGTYGRGQSERQEDDWECAGGAGSDNSGSNDDSLEDPWKEFWEKYALPGLIQDLLNGVNNL